MTVAHGTSLFVRDGIVTLGLFVAFVIFVIFVAAAVGPGRSLMALACSVEISS